MNAVLQKEVLRRTNAVYNLRNAAYSPLQASNAKINSPTANFTHPDYLMRGKKSIIKTNYLILIKYLLNICIYNSSICMLFSSCICVIILSTSSGKFHQQTAKISTGQTGQVLLNSTHPQRNGLAMGERVSVKLYTANVMEFFQAGYICEGLKPPLESFSRIDHAVIVMSNNY